MDKDEVLKLVKKNKKYSSISDDLILQKLVKYDLSGSLGKREVEGIVKEVRSEIHSSYGSFQLNKKKRERFLSELLELMKNENVEGEKIMDLHEKILKTNVSTKERILFYPELYKKLFEIIGKPKKIVDLGCGLNVFSFPFMNLSSVTYFGYDISKDDIDFINEYIDGNSSVTGRAQVWNALTANFSDIPRSDVVFMFKFLDSVGKDYKLYETMIKKLKSKCIVVSFATKKISGRKMRFYDRRWFCKMLERIGFEFDKIESDNEIFYVIT